MTVKFTVYRPPVSTNDLYAFNRKAGRMYTKKKGKEFKEDVHDAAVHAARIANWPKPELVEQVLLVVTVFNTRHDCSAAEKLTADALEGVLYKNDRVAHPRINDIAKDSGQPRVEIEVEILKEKSEY